MNRPWMPLYIADYRADTCHLSAAQHGAYLLLIMHYWQTGGLPQDDAALARIACMSAAEWKRARPTISSFFSEGWKHGRIDEEIAHAEAKFEKRSQAGKRGGNAKALLQQCHIKTDDNALASSSQPESERKNIPAKAGESSKVYAFESGVIRLAEKDFNLWKSSYSYLDLRAELLSLSKWASEQGKNWFFAVQGALAKRNREAKLAKEVQSEQSEKPGVNNGYWKHPGREGIH